MSLSFAEMIALQDVRVCEHQTIKEITPTRFYAVVVRISDADAA